MDPLIGGLPPGLPSSLMTPAAGTADPALLASRPVGDSPQAVAQVAQSFESMFVSMLLKEMRQTLEPASMFPGDSGDVMGGMFDMFLGNHLARSNALGIAEMVQRQLTAQFAAAKPTDAAPPAADGTTPISAGEGTAQNRSR